MKRSALLLVALLLIADTAKAEGEISLNMSCASVRTIYDAPQPDMTKVRTTVDLISAEFARLDRKNAKAGKPQFFARLSDEGRNSTLAVVTVRCDSHRTDTLAASAASVYAGIEAIDKAIGGN